MQYDQDVDQIIILSLNNNHKLSWTGLYKAVCESHHVSIDAFNLHVQRMYDVGLLEKEDTHVRGTRVYYSLTAKAERLKRLKLLSKPEKKEVRVKTEVGKLKRENLYILLLFLSEGYYRHTITNIEDEGIFENRLLSELRASEGDLIIKEVKDLYDRYGTHHVYTTFMPISGITLEKSKVHEKYKVQDTYEGLSDALLIASLIRQESKARDKGYIEYWYNLPGVSAKDIQGPDKVTSKHVNFTQFEIEEAFNLLCNEGILKRTLYYDDEWRYDLVDPLLKDFLADCKRLYSKVCYKVISTWKFIRDPRKEEVKWLETITRIKDVDDIRSESLNFRKSIYKKTKVKVKKIVKRKLEKVEMELIEDIEKIRRKHESAIHQHQYPANRLIELIYPEYIHKSLHL